MSPTIGFGHTFYWETSDTAVAPIATLQAGGYPQWQASVIMPSLFGTFGAWLDVRLTQASWWWRFCRRVAALGRRRRAVLVHTLATLERSEYPVAQLAVRQTATTLGFATPSAWLPYWRPIKAEPAKAENVFRRVRATQLLREQLPSTLTNPEADFLVELAYQQYAIEPWGDRTP